MIEEKLKIEGTPIFHRLLSAFFFNSIVTITIMFLAYYFYAGKTMNDLVSTQLRTVIDETSRYIDHRYNLEIYEDLMSLSSSPILDQFLSARESEAVLVRFQLERYLNQELSFHKNQKEILFLSHTGDVLAGISNGKRNREFGSIFQSTLGTAQENGKVILFNKIKAAGPGSIFYEGPYNDFGKDEVLLAGVGKRHPETGEFGGVMMVSVNIKDVVELQAKNHLFKKQISWIYTADNRLLAGQDSQDVSPDISSYLHLDDFAKDSFINILDIKLGTDEKAICRVLFVVDQEIYSKLMTDVLTRMILVLFLALLIALLAALFMGRHLAKPVIELTRISSLISQENFSETLPVKTGGEIGLLARSYNIMIERLKLLIDLKDKEIVDRLRAEERTQDTNQELLDTQSAMLNLVEDLEESKIDLQNQVDERIASVQALRKSESRFRGLIESTSDWIWEVDQNGAYTYVSPQITDILGYCPKELIGKTPFETMVPEDADRVSKLFASIMACKKSFRAMENINVHKNGHQIILETSGVPILGSEGELLGYRGVDRDISERKKSEKALQEYYDQLEQRVEERSQELKEIHEQLLHVEKLSAIGGLAASIAHEFNNPLQGIMTVIKGVKRRASMDDEDIELVEMAIKECERMKELIKSLQDFNRPSPGIVALMDIHATIESLLVLSKKDYINRLITVETYYCNNIPPLKAVADQIKQVLLNVLNNAAYACDGGGKITVKTKVVRSNTVVISIHDTGKGINADHLDKIFDPFFSTKPSTKGTGLGLSISYGIIKKHGGKIEVTSSSNMGTEFNIFLPVEGMKNE